MLATYLDDVLASNNYGSSFPAYEYSSDDFYQWTDEAWEISKDFYSGVRENREVPQRYLDKNIPIAYKQIVVGGYRMFMIIDYIFS